MYSDKHDAVQPVAELMDQHKYTEAVAEAGRQRASVRAGKALRRTRDNLYMLTTMQGYALVKTEQWTAAEAALKEALRIGEQTNTYEPWKREQLEAWLAAARNEATGDDLGDDDVNWTASVADPSLIYLVRGKDKGMAAWHYVYVDADKEAAFLVQIKSGNIDVSKYGRVLFSGWGKDPPEDIVQRLNNGDY